MAASSGLTAVPIECAIRVAQHLGLKSKTCRSLYFTANVVADLRKYLKVALPFCLSFYCHTNNGTVFSQVGNVQMVLDVLGKVRILKSNDMFAPIAANEIEDAFLQVIQMFFSF
jgi:hypothetical protein